MGRKLNRHYLDISKTRQVHVLEEQVFQKDLMKHDKLKYAKQILKQLLTLPGLTTSLLLMSLA